MTQLFLYVGKNYVGKPIPLMHLLSLNNVQNEGAF